MFNYQVYDHLSAPCPNSPTPNIVGAAAAAASSAAGSPQEAEASAKQAVKVDDSQPTTNLQLRLADGSRYSLLILLMIMISVTEKKTLIVRKSQLEDLMVYVTLKKSICADTSLF